VQDLPPRRAQLSVDHISDQVMGEAIAAQTAYTCFLLAQEPTTDGLLQALDACLHPHFSQLPQQLRGRLVPQHGTGLHSWRVGGLSRARRARIIARTESGTSARRDPSCTRAAAISPVGSSPQVPSALKRGTNHCRSRNSLSVSSRYNGCPPVCANRKSPSSESFVSGAGEGSASSVAGTAAPCSRCLSPLLIPGFASPAMA